jgi:hypothetical protein
MRLYLKKITTAKILGAWLKWEMICLASIGP